MIYIIKKHFVKVTDSNKSALFSYTLSFSGCKYTLFLFNFHTMTSKNTFPFVFLTENANKENRRATFVPLHADGNKMSDF